MGNDTLFSGESGSVEYKVAVPSNSEKHMKTLCASRCFGIGETWDMLQCAGGAMLFAAFTHARDEE